MILARKSSTLVRVFSQQKKQIETNIKSNLIAIEANVTDVA